MSLFAAPQPRPSFSAMTRTAHAPVAGPVHSARSLADALQSGFAAQRAADERTPRDPVGTATR